MSGPPPKKRFSVGSRFEAWRVLRSGFTLVEVLVALVVAGLFLAVFGRAFATAWGASHTPLEIVSAVSIAKFVAAPGTPDDSPADGRIAGFAFERRSEAVAIEIRPSGLAPAPPSTGPGAAGAAPASRPPPLELRQIAVVVTTPSRRRLNFATIRLESDRPQAH